MLIFIQFLSPDSSVQKWKKVILAKYLKTKQYHQMRTSLTAEKTLKA